MYKILPIILVFAMTLVFSDPAYAWIFTKWNQASSVGVSAIDYIAHAFFGAFSSFIYIISSMLCYPLGDMWKSETVTTIAKIFIFLVLLKYVFENFLISGVISYIAVSAYSSGEMDKKQL